MSKRQTKETIWNRLRRGLAGILSLALLLGLLPSTALTAHASSSWAMPYMNQLVEWGIMRGDIGGNLAPDRNITRAEFVTLMNRAYGYTTLKGTPFTDVPSWQWYAEDVDIAYNMGYFKGTSPTTAAPEDPLTREQAAVLLSRNMMLQGTTGETLGFSDTRQLSEWSRNLVGAAAAEGVINGYDDGSFRPLANITRGEVAAMLVRAIGTPINTAGEHTLGSVYGNVTVNTPGVTLRDGVIVGNLYLTGGIDLGDVLLENVTVLGEIIVSGAGESNSSKSSVILRNVTAEGMIVDSISNQFVTIRAEGNTKIDSTSVRTNAFLDDSSLPGYGLSYIELDGEEGTLLQLAGSVKEVVNLTPKSDLQVVQGSVEKITMDEYATDSSVLVADGTRVDELDLDVGTNVTGTGDIKNLNVGSSGSSVAVLPDNITIRPGITTNINGSTMNSTQAAESSLDPKLLAGYPAVKNVAPNSATLVFSGNKAGTIYWAISALADGSVKEEDLITPPSYGGKILRSGSIRAAASNTEYTAQVTGLTTDGSYYVSAILVDSRDNRSPLKVTAFTTPDGTTPGFTSGYPRMTMTTTETSQVTVMTNKSCQLYYALLPAGSTAPTPQDFKSASISGNLGYGTVNAIKNVALSINVNRQLLRESTQYDLYLWLTDYNGAKSSTVRKLTFTTQDETPPVVTEITQTDAGATTADISYVINESPATLYWAVVTEANFNESIFMNHELDSLAAKVKVEKGTGALVKGNSNRGSFRVTGLNSNTTHTSSYVLYYVAKDQAGNYSDEVKYIHIRTLDTIAPTVKQEFTSFNPGKPDEPMANTDIRLVFSETVKGGTSEEDKTFLELYNDVLDAIEKEDEAAEAKARDTMAQVLYDHIKLYNGSIDSRDEVCSDMKPIAGKAQVINYHYAQVTSENGKMIVTFPTNEEEPAKSALHLSSGATYHFELSRIYDDALIPNPLTTNNYYRLPDFRTVFARVELTISNSTDLGLNSGTTHPNDNDPDRIDRSFVAHPVSVDTVDPAMRWDMLIWSDTNIEFTLYSRTKNADGTWGTWAAEGTAFIRGVGDEKGGYAFRSLHRSVKGNPNPQFPLLKDLTDKEYAIHIDQLDQMGNLSPDYKSWNGKVNIRISIVAGEQYPLELLSSVADNFQDSYDNALKDSINGVSSIGVRDPFTAEMSFSDSSAPEIVNGFPTIAVSDTTAQIRTIMNNPGRIYYIAFPLSDLKTADGAVDAKLPIKDDGTTGPTSGGKLITEYTPAVGVRLTETDTAQPALTLIQNINGVNKGTPIATPSRDLVTGGTFTSDVIKGSTANVAGNTASVINLSSLKPNTIYFICMVTRGTSVDSYADQAVCFRFVTEQSIKPVIKLQVENNSDVRATVDRTSEVYAKLLVQNNMGAPFTSWFTYTDGTPGSGNATTTKPGGSPITVLQAMIQDYQGPNSNGESVFDHYANDTLKGEIAQLIRDGNVGDTILETKGPITITARQQPSGALSGSELLGFDENKMDEDAMYVCVAVARSSMGSGDAFRAAQPVQRIDKNPPQITSVAVNLTTEKDAATGKLTTTGKVTVNFDKVLYLPNGGTRYPLGHKASGTDFTVTGADGQTYTTLVGKIMGLPTGVGFEDQKVIREISSLVFEFTAATGNNWTLTMPNGLCNRWGYIFPAGATVKVTYDEKNNNHTWALDARGR